MEVTASWLQSPVLTGFVGPAMPPFSLYWRTVPALDAAVAYEEGAMMRVSLAWLRDVYRSNLDGTRNLQEIRVCESEEYDWVCSYLSSPQPRCLASIRQFGCSSWSMMFPEYICRTFLLSETRCPPCMNI